MTDENRRENLRLALEASGRELQDARTLLDAGSPSGSVGHSYYAAYHAARALMLSLGEEPRTHSGLQARVNLRFVRTGRLSAETGSWLSVLFAHRQSSTYDTAAVFTPEMARSALDEATRFTQAATDLLRADGWLR